MLAPSVEKVALSMCIREFTSPQASTDAIDDAVRKGLIPGVALLARNITGKVLKRRLFVGSSTTLCLAYGFRTTGFRATFGK